MPKRNKDGANEKWNRFKDYSLDFLKSILGIMQNWMDNTQSTIPGYKDRIVHIHLNPEQGGLNLNMGEDVITKLSERGKHAGIKLRSRFCDENTDERELNWNNHRWIRFRTTMCLIQGYLTNLEKALEIPSSSYEKGYIDMLNRPEGEDPKFYEFSKSQKLFAIDIVNDLRKLNQKLTGNKRFCENKDAPKPRPEIRMRPRI